MKKEDVDKLLDNIDLPDTENIIHQRELKIPLLSYKKSSRTGLWLLLLPAVFAITSLLKYEFGLLSGIQNNIEDFFAAIDNSRFLTYLIPVLFAGLPLTAMIINFMAFCHFSTDTEKKELHITIKYRPFNIAVFLFAFAVLVFFMMPDKLSF